TPTRAAQPLSLSAHRVFFFGGPRPTRGANALSMPIPFPRHINGDVLERAIFEYDYVLEVELPEGAKTLTAGPVLSDTREPCFYARRHGRRLYMGYEETAETSPEIIRHVPPRTPQAGQPVLPPLPSPPH